MAKAKRRRKASLHSAGKVQEADLLERARALRDDPALAMPVCDGPCVLFSPVEAARKGILKAHAARDDEAKLQRLAKSGNDLARAYAAALLVARDDKIPYVAEVKLAGMSAPYVVRGKAKPLYLAGLFNHDDRQLRLLAVSKWVKKRRLHFYSADRGIVCTGKRDAPPRDFVQEEMEALGLREQGGRFACEHGGSSGADAIVLLWKSAGVSLERCAKCFDDVPTLAAIARHTAIPGALSSFDVSVALAPLTPAAGAPVDAPAPIPEAELAAYRAGARTDAQLVEAARASRIENLRQRAGRLLVAGGATYGDDVDAFLVALNPTPAEAQALRAALAARARPVVLDRASSARALAELWPDHGLAMLEAASGDAEAARRLHKERVTSDEAVELIRRAQREGVHGRVAATLPGYRNLPPQAATADAVARAFRAGGQDAAVRVAMERASGGKAKGVALAFLHALGAAKGQEWRFSNVDAEAAEALAGPVERLLRGPPEGYHEALREASLLAGETVEFAPGR